MLENPQCTQVLEEIIIRVQCMIDADNMTFDFVTFAWNPLNSENSGHYQLFKAI